VGGGKQTNNGDDVGMVRGWVVFKEMLHSGKNLAAGEDEKKK